MIPFSRYGHIDSLLRHYADKLDNQAALAILNSGVSEAATAETLSTFVWQSVSEMAQS